MADQQSNPWGLATIGLLMVGATALLTGVVVARYGGADKSVAVAAGVHAPPGTVGGPAAGTVCGLNDANRSDARAAAVYRACVKQGGQGG